MDQRNLLIAIVFSVSILLGYQMLFEQPRVERERAAQEAARSQREAAGETTTAAKPGAATTPGAPATPAKPGVAAGAPTAPGTAAAASVPRIKIESKRVTGSLSLQGARLDELRLDDYRETLAKDSPQITLLAPPGAAHPYFAQFGWVPVTAGTKTPAFDTVWAASTDRLEPGRPVVLSWDNGQGLVFTQEISLDRNYMFTVVQRIANRGTADVDVKPYGLISRSHLPETKHFFILHEGPLGVFNDTLKEESYDNLKDEGTIAQTSRGGWIGITDKYWLAALIPDPKATTESSFRHALQGTVDKYQVDMLGAAVHVPAGGTAEVTQRVFAGAKEVRLLDRYSDDLGIARFDLAVDFGWFYFLTKPIFYVLEFFYRHLGNFGLAILLLTVLIKAAFFPLANKSYKAMSRLKKLQPQMMEIRERYKDDRARQNQEMMALYKREKANPISGCFPILIQIPVFFSLYKVLFVTIEMRQAPFYGWIHDLSAPDPLGVLTLFGLIHWQVPDMLHIVNIGIWPLIMGGTMFLQQKLNPQPADPTQAKIFMLLPVVFTFLLGRFPAGLVIYWAWNNTLSCTQQWIIMRRMGVTASGTSTPPLGGGGKATAGPSGKAAAAASGAPGRSAGPRPGAGKRGRRASGKRGRQDTPAS